MFVSRINNLLSRLGKTKAQFYQDLSLPNNALTKWKYNAVPNVETAFNVARYLNTTVEYLVTGKESSPYKEELDSLKSDLRALSEKYSH